MARSEMLPKLQQPKLKMTLPLNAVKSSASINLSRSNGNFFFLEINYEFSFLPLFSLALIAQTVSVRTKVQLLM